MDKKIDVEVNIFKPELVNKFIGNLDLVRAQIKKRETDETSPINPEASKLYDRIYALVKSVKKWKQVGNDSEVQV